MSGTCKEWFDSIGCKSTLDKEQYTHLVWCAALASKVENFTSTNKQSTPCDCCGDAASFHQCVACASEYGIVK